MTQDNEIYIHLTRFELGRMVWGLWRPYAPVLAFRLPQTAAFVMNLKAWVEGMSSMDEMRPFDQFGALEALAELEGEPELDDLRLDAIDKDHVNFVLECVAGAIKAEAAFQKKREGAADEACACAPATGARSWQVWAAMTELGPRTFITDGTDDDAIVRLKTAGMERKKTIEGDIMAAFAAADAVAAEMRAGRGDG